MSHSEDRHRDFVLKHYKEGAFDKQKAIGRFMDARGIRPKPRRRWNFAAVGVISRRCSAPSEVECQSYAAAGCTE